MCVALLHLVALVVNLRLRVVKTIPSSKMETVVNLSDAQQLAIEKFKALVGDEQMDGIIAQGPEVFLSRHEAFMSFESGLLGQVYDHIASAVPA